MGLENRKDEKEEKRQGLLSKITLFYLYFK